MSQIIPIYIPTYINNAEYAPARVLPRLLFYNGLLDCQTYWIESGSATFGGVTYEQNKFPYFDNYNVVSGQFPTSDSLSLLFNNEGASYGQVPTENLYTTYWEKYIEFIYNPTTRILNCQAIIPLADYFKMELNDIVNFRGNYWHLRAINDYSLKDGTCNLQLVGPVISDVFDIAPPVPPAQASSSVSWSYTESSQNGTFTVYDNATTIATLTANGNGNTQVSESHYVTASLVPVSYPSSGSVTMSININGGTILAVTGSTNTTISASFLVGAAQTYNITGSIEWNDVPPFTIDYLIVAGGGGGGTSNTTTVRAGGGGAGGFDSGSTTLTSGTYPIVVGTGGAGAISGGANSVNGTNSSFNSITKTGGGRGGINGTTLQLNGGNGGSGGGAVNGATAGTGIAGEGFNGSNGQDFSPQRGGCGGGALEAATSTQAGSAKQWLDGLYYAAGGAGSNSSDPNISGIYGSGGAGSLNVNGITGQNGVVIIRYSGTPVATGGTITQSGGYTYHTFTSSSNFVY